MRARASTPEDAGEIARIYNQGIEERAATFETRLRSAEEIRSWYGGPYPVVVVEEDGRIVAFAATFAYRPGSTTGGLPSSPSMWSGTTGGVGRGVWRSGP